MADRKLVHTQRIDIRWGDMDEICHVNNTVYFRYMEQARIGWFESLVPRGEAWRSMGIVIVNASCHFNGPLPAAAFSLLMLLGTRGRQYSLPELRQMLEAAGFVDIETARTGGGYYSLVSARRP
jgi:hypothetical protein